MNFGMQNLKSVARTLGIAMAMLSVSIQAQQVPIPTTPAQVPGPVPGNMMTTAYVQFVGRIAYMWGYPLVNAHNRRAAFAEAPAPGLLGGVVPVAPIGYSAMPQREPGMAIRPKEKKDEEANYAEDDILPGGFAVAFAPLAWSQDQSSTAQHQELTTRRSSHLRRCC